MAQCYCKSPGLLATSPPMNAVEKYFAQSGDTPSALSRRTGRAAQTIGRVLRGKRNATTQLAKAIEEATKGKLKATDFILCCMAGPIVIADGRKKRRDTSPRQK